MGAWGYTLRAFFFAADVGGSKMGSIRTLFGEHMKISIPEAGIEGNYKRLDSTPPPGSKAKSVMTVEATVEVRPQALRTIRPQRIACLRIPPGLDPLGQYVLTLLFACFEKQQNVKEGVLGDLIFGFEASGIPPDKTLSGLSVLHRAGYLKFQSPSPDNSYVDFTCDRVLDAWVRYQPALLEMVYEEGA